MATAKEIKQKRYAETFKKYRKHWAELLEKEIKHYDQVVNRISDNYEEIYKYEKIANVWSEWEVYVWGEWFRYLCVETSDDLASSLCAVCPINVLYGDCLNHKSPFYKMTKAKNWKEWLKYARKGREILRRLLEKCRDEEWWRIDVSIWIVFKRWLKKVTERSKK